MKAKNDKRANLIAKYRQLGTDMKELRASHLADIEKLIEKYKADKKAIQEKREAILEKLKKPENESAEVEQAASEAA